MHQGIEQQAAMQARCVHRDEKYLWWDMQLFLSSTVTGLRAGTPPGSIFTYLNHQDLILSSWCVVVEEGGSKTDTLWHWIVAYRTDRSVVEQNYRTNDRKKQCLDGGTYMNCPRSNLSQSLVPKPYYLDYLFPTALTFVAANASDWRDKHPQYKRLTGLR